MNKSADSSSLSTIPIMLARLSFLPTLAYNVAMERLSAREWWNRVDESVILGALPFKNKVLTKELVTRERISGVVSMNEDYELKHLTHTPKEYKEDLGVDFLQLATIDIFHAPEQEKLIRGVEFMQRLTESSDKCVYVHCKAGRTRSATLVGCFLMAKYGWNPDTVHKHMLSKRPHVTIRKPQWGALHTYYKNHVEKT